MRLLLPWLIVLLAVIAAQAQSESLGDRLLDDLDPGLFGAPAELDPRDPELRFRPPRRSGAEGSDVGGPTGGAPLPLVRVRQGMQMVELLLAEDRAVAEARDVQGQVVRELDALIAELEKQCRGGSGQPSNESPPSERSQADAPRQSATPGRGQTAARDSTSRLGSAAAQPVEPATLDDLIKDLWGHLPARSREQLLQSFSDEFLPKYQLEIEQYYRRLAEDDERIGHSN